MAVYEFEFSIPCNAALVDYMVGRDYMKIWILKNRHELKAHLHDLLFKNACSSFAGSQEIHSSRL
ncbi:hypothetical protein DRN77_08650 [Methanosarcinales archaeon]|nr:MAG: hypothetical protein DRN77_08650 [Methanosarcinales archaeon]